MVAAAGSACAPYTDEIYKEPVYLLADLRKVVLHAPNGETLYRWARRGCVNRFTNQRVFLQVISLPVGLGTSYNAISRFYQSLNSEVRFPIAPKSSIPTCYADRKTKTSFKKRPRPKRKKS